MGVGHQKQRAPGPRGNVLFGSLLQVRRDPLQFYLEARRGYGDVVRIPSLGRHCWYLISHPEDVEYVLRSKHFQRGPFLRPVRALLGKGLLTSEGALWLQQRRMAQPAFHEQRLQQMAVVFTDEAESVRHQWQRYVDDGQALQVEQEMSAMTLKIIMQVLFGTDLAKAVGVVGQSLSTALDYINHCWYHPLALPLRYPTPLNRRFLQARQRLDALVYLIIDTRRRTGRDRDDLLSMLLQAQDAETGVGMSDRQLRDEVMTLVLAGHETSALVLTWTWYLLARHPEVEHRLHAELDHVLKGRIPSLTDLPHLPYTHMVLEEAMRLYPPTWGVGRQLTQDDEIRGYHLAAGSSVIVSQYVTHHHPDFWEDPESFRPARFLPECKGARPRYAYFPFGGGRHSCIGAHLAMLELPLVLATLAQQYRLGLVSDSILRPKAFPTLRPDGSLWMNVQHRH